jgi:hypothetical protein
LGADFADAGTFAPKPTLSNAGHQFQPTRRQPQTFVRRRQTLFYLV